MEPSKEAIAVRLTRLNRLILGKVTGANTKFCRRTIDREALLDALTVLYDDCNDDPAKKEHDLVKAFVNKYRTTVFELRRTRVCMADFTILQVIGRGHFGEVHMVKEKETGDVYALKTLRKDASSKNGSACVEEEREILASVKKSWLPRLQYAFQDQTNLYLVMELCSGGDLAGLLARRQRPLAEKDAAFYIAEVVHALKALHTVGYVHRDIKPQNILIDRCGHIKLGDFGSCARLSERWINIAPVGTADYVAPELLAAADCAAKHSECSEVCGRLSNVLISACDYWSLGVMAFELVTLQRPFSSDDEDSIAKILSNIQKYERQKDPSPPFPAEPEGPSREWRSLVKGLLTVHPGKRYNYLDTLQSAALRHISVSNVRDQVPPWVPSLRGPEDASYFAPPPRPPQPPSAASFRTREPFAGQLPFIGFSYVSATDTEDSSGLGTSYSSCSSDSTVIDLASYKSAEKLAIMRAKEISNLQSKLASAERAANAEAEKARRAIEHEAEVTRARLQAEITALTLQNKRLERQLEVEKEERMALERNNQEVSSIKERNTNELRKAQAHAAEIECQWNVIKEELGRAEGRMMEMRAEVERARADAETARAQQKHYKNVIDQVRHGLNHRRVTELNVRAIDTVAKERALRRQTLTGAENENREAAARLAQAEAAAAKEARARDEAERKLVEVEKAAREAEIQLQEVRRELATIKATQVDKKRIVEASVEELKQVQIQLTQERVKSSTLIAQVQDLQQAIEEASRRETALEEQCVRTEARLNERLEAAESRAADTLKEDARHREKVQKLEQLVRQLEREVNALEARNDNLQPNVASDTESTGGDDAALAQVALLKEQLEKAEAQLQARADEMAALRQEARTANLARWRKEKEFNDLQGEAKTSARDVKRLEERIATATESRRKAEQKATTLQNELTELTPKYEAASKELAKTKELFGELQKTYEAVRTEVERSRNDILKLKSELQYSERRRARAETQEELGGRERAALRDEAAELRATAQHYEQTNKALQEACTMMEDQLTDLEKLADLADAKNKDLETETTRLREELSACRAKLSESERLVAEKTAALTSSRRREEDLAEQAASYAAHVEKLTERLDAREALISSLESKTVQLESTKSTLEAAVSNAARRVRQLQEECAAAHTRAHDHHAAALAAAKHLAEAQEELASAKEAAEGAAAWWRTRETKADATLRQQAKLIDFLQAKVEEANRKKSSFGNKLFGRSGRRPSTASPPLRRANKELREEVDRLRSKLAVLTNGDPTFQPTTPMKQRAKPVNGTALSIDTPDCAARNKKTEPKTDDDDSYVQLVWKDGRRERVKATASEGVLEFSLNGKTSRGCLVPSGATLLLSDEANRAFTIRLESDASDVSVVCSSIQVRDKVRGCLRPTGYWPAALAASHRAPHSALLVNMQAIALGCPEGLRSLRGPIRLEWESDRSELPTTPVTQIASTGGRAVLLCGATALHGSLASLESALRRAENLRPALTVARVRLPDTTAPHLIQVSSSERAEGARAAVACGRRVFLLRFDAAVSDFKISRSITVDRSPSSLLLTERALYIAGEKPLRILLPNGALEAFAMDEPIIAAAAKKHSPPKAILLIRKNPVEILLCYTECGVFVDENGKRTRSEDPKWRAAVETWQFVNPFLYAVSNEGVTITYISDDAYKSSPCTCDDHSVASTPSECYMPQTYTVRLDEAALLGTAPNGILVRNKTGAEYSVTAVEGLPAFRSIGASVESLETISDTKSLSTDYGQSMTDLSPQEHDTSQESVEPNTGFHADIKKRARQLRMKNGAPDDVIKKILTTEVDLKRRSSGRASPPPTSEYSTDSESDDPRESNKENNNPISPADLCAEMFTKQVRFH